MNCETSRDGEKVASGTAGSLTGGLIIRVRSEGRLASSVWLYGQVAIYLWTFFSMQGRLRSGEHSLVTTALTILTTRFTRQYCTMSVNYRRYGEYL